MDSRAWNLTLLTVLGALWLACGIQREKPVIGAAADQATALAALESDVAAHPNDAARRRELAQAYLDARAPGLALRVIASAPSSSEAGIDAAMEHVHARALLEEGLSPEALAAERRVLEACAAPHPPDVTFCASAARRVVILQELVALGVDDARAHPEASAIAYRNATHEVRLAHP